MLPSLYVSTPRITPRLQDFEEEGRLLLQGDHVATDRYIRYDERENENYDRERKRHLLNTADGLSRWTDHSFDSFNYLCAA